MPLKRDATRPIDGPPRASSSGSTGLPTPAGSPCGKLPRATARLRLTAEAQYSLRMGTSEGPRTPDRLAIAVGLLVLLGLGWFRPFRPELPNPNEVSRMYLTLALVDDRRTTIDGPIQRHGMVLDHARRLAHRYSDKAPGVSFLGVPLYVLGHGWVHGDGPDHVLERAHLLLRLSASVLPSALFAALAFGFLAAYLPDRRLRALLLLGLVFATPWRFYGDLLFGHVPAGVMAASSLFCVERAVRGSSRRLLLLSGILAGSTFMIEYLGAVALVGALLLLALHRRLGWSPWLFAGAAGPIALTLAYHQAAFGQALTPGYARIGTGYAALHAQGMWGIGWPTLEALSGLSFSLHRGLFVMAPWLLVGLVGWVKMAKEPTQRPLGVALALTAVGWLLLAAGFPAWEGGGAAGPRHIVATIPLFLVPLAVAMNELTKSGWLLRVALGASALYALALTTQVTSTFLFFQPGRDNPYRDVSLALLRRGICTPSLGAVAGLHGIWGAVPYWLGAAVSAVIATRLLVGRRVVDLIAAGSLALTLYFLILTRAPEAQSQEAEAEVDRLAATLDPPRPGK